MRDNLLIVRAGDASTHPAWLTGGGRSFDLFVSYYGAQDRRYADQCEYYEAAAGAKFPPLARILADRWDVVSQYRYVGFPDDDLYADAGDWDRLFAIMADRGIDLAQPSLVGHLNWPHTGTAANLLLRWAAPVEVMTPVFSARALAVVRHTFAENQSGWGLDHLWADMLERLGYPIAIVDAVAVEHTRVGGSGDLNRVVYPRLKVDPEVDAQRLAARHGLVRSHRERGRLPLPPGMRAPGVAAVAPPAPPGAGRIYSFGVAGAVPFTRTLRLDKGGRVGGYKHANERSWAVRDGVLEFIDGGGRTTCRFTEFDPYACALAGTNHAGKRHYLRDGTAAWTGLPPKGAFEVVVARHGEDLAWTEVIADNVTVYNKGAPDKRWTPIPNVGREFGTYLHHVVHNWDRLAGHTLFVQGNPFVHPLLPLPMYLEADFVSPATNVKSSGPGFISAQSKAAFWRRYVRTEMPPYTAYSPGAQFSVAAATLRRRGRVFWRDLYELSQAPVLRFEDAALDNYGIGILLEYWWPYLVNAGRRATLNPAPIRGTFQGRTTTEAMLAHFFREEAARGSFVLPRVGLEW